MRYHIRDTGKFQAAFRPLLKLTISIYCEHRDARIRQIPTETTKNRELCSLSAPGKEDLVCAFMVGRQGLRGSTAQL